MKNLTQRNNSVLFSIVLVFIIFAMPVIILAESVEYIQVKSIRLNDYFKINHECRVTAFRNISEDQIEDASAKICFYLNHGDKCFEAKSFNNDHVLNFQNVKKLSVTPIFKSKEPRNAVLFEAEYSGEGSGSLNLITLWIYDVSSKEFINILPLIQITEQGEYQLLTAKDGLAGVFITADYIWDVVNETHFSPHKYEIKIYLFDNKKKTYVFKEEYTTKSKYKSLNDVDHIDVIVPEIKKIKSLLKKK